MNFFSIYTQLLHDLPEYLTRKQVGASIGHIMSPKYLANLDSEGMGPPKTMLHRKTVYHKEGLVAWLVERASNPVKRLRKKSVEPEKKNSAATKKRRNTKKFRLRKTGLPHRKSAWRKIFAVTARVLLHDNAPVVK